MSTPVEPVTTDVTALTDVENSVMSVTDTEEDTGTEVAAALEPVPTGNTGAMVALVPSQGNIDRLAAPDGEHPDELHCTVCYLGEAADVSDDAFEAIMEAVVAFSEDFSSPVVGEGFNVGLFNPHRDDRETCVVLGLSGNALGEAHGSLMARLLERLEEVSQEIPDQHSPWIPHVTLAYTDDHARVGELADRTGDITFDRIRVAIGDDVYDVSLIPDDGEDVEIPEDISDTPEESQDFHVDMIGNATVEANGAVGGESVDGEITEESESVDTSTPGAWHGVLVVEDVESGDGRMFSGGSLKTAPLPLPLMWQKQTAEGHQTAVQAGRIDDVWRVDNQIWGSGVFDLEGVDGAEAYRQVEAKFLRGVSVDVDSVKEADVEMVFPKTAVGDEEDMAQLFSAPELTVFHKGRLRGATLVQFPAFVEASISLDGPGIQTMAPAEGDAVTAGADLGTVEIEAFAELNGERIAVGTVTVPVQDPECEHDTDAVTACGCEDENAPDPSYFTYPGFTEPTPLTVDGMRIFGHGALKGTCHTGFSGQCVTMPRETSHDYYLLGETLCSDGSIVATGTITLGTGHAGTDGSVTPVDAMKHYDHTGTVVADVVTGEDEFGLWFSGSLRPNLSTAKVRSLRAAKLSGDWRKFGRNLRLVALLAVNVPGFPVPRLRTASHEGRQTALVAAGINPLDARTFKARTDNDSLKNVVASLAKRIGRDPATRMSELKSQVHGR